MDFYLFIIIVVAIMTFGEVATKVGIPLSKRLAEILGDRAGGGRESPSLPSADVAEAMEALENRLARIEDRLDFLEELKAPPERPSLYNPEMRDRPDHSD